MKLSYFGGALIALSAALAALVSPMLAVASALAGFGARLWSEAFPFADRTPAQITAAPIAVAVLGLDRTRAFEVRRASRAGPQRQGPWADPAGGYLAAA